MISTAKSKLLVFFIWASLATQILIVVTGGLVRLTGSGLGCPTWPKCTDESLITVPEQGIHGVIEFANRLLTFVLLIVALATVWFVWRSAKVKTHKLLLPAILLLLGIPAQAVLGGFTVLFKLNPWFVGAHFVLSGLLIAIASVLVWRYYWAGQKIENAGAAWLNWGVAISGVLSVLIGVLVTGAGPHSGDAQSARNGLDLEVWQHVHSYPAYLLLALAIWQLLASRQGIAGNEQAQNQRLVLRLRISLLLCSAIAVQALIGVIQARLGVPPLLVGLHMLGASVLCSLLTFNFLANRK